jgi:hypothetical protein
MLDKLARSKEKKIEPHHPRCWDGLLGCEQSKSKSEFKYHPRICNTCMDALCFKYQVPHADAEMLTLLLSMDAGMYRTARYLKAEANKIGAMERFREKYIPQFLSSLKPLKSRHEIEAKGKAFRAWWSDQIGMDKSKSFGSAVNGFVTPSEVVQ